jgi:hypothetical protein
MNPESYVGIVIILEIQAPGDMIYSVIIKRAAIEYNN